MYGWAMAVEGQGVANGRDWLELRAFELMDVVNVPISVFYVWNENDKPNKVFHKLNPASRK